MAGVVIGADTAATKRKVGDSDISINASLSCNITIKNIVVSGTIINTNPTGITAGGIIGKTYTAGTLTVVDSTNNVSITACERSKFAGIAGYVKAAVFSKCVNNGAITMEYDGREISQTANTNSALCAGIACFAGNNITFNSCTNNGVITMEEPYTHSLVPTGCAYIGRNAISGNGYFEFSGENTNTGSGCTYSVQLNDGNATSKNDFSNGKWLISSGKIMTE